MCVFVVLHAEFVNCTEIGLDVVVNQSVCIQACASKLLDRDSNPQHVCVYQLVLWCPDLRADTLMVVGMDESWPSIAEFCNRDGASCYVTATETKHKYPCTECNIVNDFLVKRGWLCAVCLRTEKLEEGHGFCIGQPCFNKQCEHLLIQKSKSTNDVQQPVNSGSVADPVVPDLQPCPQPPPLHQQTGRQDGSRSLGAFTVSSTSQAALTGIP